MVWWESVLKIFFQCFATVPWVGCSHTGGKSWAMPCSILMGSEGLRRALVPTASTVNKVWYWCCVTTVGSCLGLILSPDVPLDLCSSLPLRLVFFSSLVSYHANDFEQRCFNYMALCTSSCGNLSPKIHLLAFILRHQISQGMDSWTNSTLPNAATKHTHWEINLKPKGTKRENSALQN